MFFERARKDNPEEQGKMIFQKMEIHFIGFVNVRRMHLPCEKIFCLKSLLKDGPIDRSISEIFLSKQKNNGVINFDAISCEILSQEEEYTADCFSTDENIKWIA